MLDKIDTLKRIFKTIDPNVELGVDQQSDTSATVIGPFPSFMILVGQDGPLRAIIHINADAPNMVYIMGEFQKELDVVLDGAFAIDGEKGTLLFNVDAYAKKEDNILMLANDIIQRRQVARQESIIMPEDKKIILS
jgi:hypothetical protein